MLFARLPDDIFRPLAGPNRAVYQEILLTLYALFFDDEAVDLFPARELVQRELEEQLARMARLDWAIEEDDDAEEKGEGGGAIPALANRILRRLIQTGWLDEEREGYERPKLVMPPAVNALLRTLLDISRHEKKSYGGTVLNILNNIEAALANPLERALGIEEAVRTAREFNDHLTAMIYGLRDLQGRIATAREPRAILQSFFDDFVADILVADYKTLKTKNNPFRFRRRILSILDDLRQDGEQMGLLVTGYSVQLGLTEGEARRRLEEHLRLIVRVFESVEGRLARIDQFRYRLEQRVADTVRYMDKTIPGARSRFADLLLRIGTVASAAPAHFEQLPAPDGLVRPLPLAPHSMRLPARHRIAAEPAVLRISDVDRAVLARREALKLYEKRRRATPRMVEDYLERNLAGRVSLPAEEFTISTVEEYIAFSYSHRLLALGIEGARLRQRFRVEPAEGVLRTPWVECRRFTIHRLDPSSEAETTAANVMLS